MPSPHFAHAGALASAILLFALLAAPASSQTLHDFVEAAAARNPDLAALTGRRDAIGARQSAADALTPGAPTFSGSYATDQVLRNRQQREAQIGISTPIWLPGEGTASRHVADAELSRSSAQAAAIKLKVAGQVRDSLAEFALAQAELAVAERRLRDARTLEGDVSRRARAREASEADVLLARAERIATDGELRDRAILAVLLGCVLRRSEVAALTVPHVQQRDGRWCIVDLVGKHGRVRTIPMPTWVKVAIDAWTPAAGVADGYVFRPVNRAGQVQVGGLSEKVVWQLLQPYALAAGVPGIAPHDLRSYAESRTMPHMLNSGPPAAWAEQTDSA